MGRDAAELTEPLPYSSGAKVHRLMCAELTKLVDRISQIFPAIEAARPRCKSGIETLCSLNLAMEKAKLLLQHCMESSKLYLAITGNSILLRCERVRSALEESLYQIQDMVPLLLAAQISAIVDDLRKSKFIMDSSEEEAGSVLLALLRQSSDSMEEKENEVFQVAVSRLDITSPKAFLIEKRSIKKLLDKVRDTDQRKERILKYFLHLLRKYEKSIEQTHNSISFCEVQSNFSEPNKEFVVRDVQTDISSKLTPPDEFKCPISSKLMCDPVVIASGQTFERVWIEKWINEGQDTCPKTHMKLSHLSITPNSVIKELISKWCRNHGVSTPDRSSHPISAALLSWKSSSSTSIASFGSSLADMPILGDDSGVSFESLNTSSDVSQFNSLNLGSPRINCSLLSKLPELPWESQCKEVQDFKTYLNDSQMCHLAFSTFVIESVVRFINDGCKRKDLEAQRIGMQALLVVLEKCRSKIPPLDDDVFYLLASFLGSEIKEEALAIMQVLSVDQESGSKIVMSGALSLIFKVLESQVQKLQAPAVEILYNISSHNNIESQILFLDNIPKLIPLLGDSSLAGVCIKFISYLSNTKEGRIAIAETDECVASIAELLETGSQEEQEHSVAVFLSLCSHHFEYCQLLLKEGVIPSLVNISVNGNPKAKESAMKLLRILRDITYSSPRESSPPHIVFIPDLPCNPSSYSTEKEKSSKAPTFFGRKLKIFSRHRSSALV
ncbi:hypothetical protein GIB67_042791 [Kingdonia uniflora]|uniref:RING-type E3 ubiquitin transferase n=1 Tax=Kingdonia uniflora TaxID=39325 RepID=A0A7J7L105_9MAGN|nr:hypothetical protein GIB67_042791 [Kingdonia uniflora]